MPAFNPETNCKPSFQKMNGLDVRVQTNLGAVFCTSTAVEGVKKSHVVLANLSILLFALLTLLTHSHVVAQSIAPTEELVTTEKVRQTAGILAARATTAIRELKFPKYSGKAGVLIAEGDSWYDYPFYDVLQQLEGLYQYKIESVAHKGDVLEAMVYDESQLASLALKMSRLASVEPKQAPIAILLSGGGNDVAGPELSLLLNHSRSGLPQLNESIISGVFDVRLQMSYLTLIEAVTVLSKQYFDRTLPILIHGYDFPVADGRGFLGGASILPGPWFKPYFEQKGYSDIQANTDTLKILVTRFNSILERIPSTPGFEHVCYVKLTGTLSSVIANDKYKKDWGNELHPTRDGFRHVTERFQESLLKCAKR